MDGFCCSVLRRVFHFFQSCFFRSLSLSSFSSSSLCVRLYIDMFAFTDERLSEASDEIENASSINMGEPVEDAQDDGKVFLNTYDLIEQNTWLHLFGMGIYHSGVQIYGLEIAFGGHPYDSSGIFATIPRTAPGCVRFRESIYVGRTTLSRTQVRQVLVELGQTYKGTAYNLLQRNCNTFAEDFCYRLTGKRPPSWINRAAQVAIQLHCLFPPGWMPPLRPPEAPASEDQREDDATQSLLQNLQANSHEMERHIQHPFPQESIEIIGAPKR